MNFDEAFDVIRQLAVEWPQIRDWTDEKAQSWVDDLQHLDYERATAAVKRCRDEHHYLPSWAQFREAYRTVTYQQMAPERQPYTKELRSGVLDRQETARRIRRVRDLLAERPHDHRRGSANCPTCGRHEIHEGAHRPERCVRCKKVADEAYQAIKETP